eukprot:c6940_g1_i3.p1 GENE.c6940_g1_i3~~c6940_g1_i3.p1  ORF type:complete len:173 (+),score=38.14 c6940_g1_i3:398-916(+)
MVIVVEQGAQVCRNATVTGNVVIGSGSLIHPTSVISSPSGKIVIGSKSMVEECAQIKNTGVGTMSIGSGTVCEVGCYIESSSVGDGTIIQAKARVNAGCVIGDGCVIGICVEVPPNTIVPNHTVLFQDASHSRTVTELGKRNTKLCHDEIDFITSKKLLESNHRLYEVGKHE